MSSPLRLASLCLGLCVLGWTAVALVAVFLPGGHPPLVAYVGGPVLLATLPVSGLGLMAAAVSFRKGEEAWGLRLALLAGNGAMFAIAVTIFLIVLTSVL